MPDAIPSYVLNQQLIANPQDYESEGDLHRVHLHHLDPYGTLVFAESPQDAIDIVADYYEEKEWMGVFIDTSMMSPEEIAELEKTEASGEVERVGNHGHAIQSDEISFVSYCDPLIVDAARALAYLRQLQVLKDPKYENDPRNVLKQMATGLEKILWPMT